MKLTEPQRILLTEIVRQPRYVAPYYKPAIRLVQMELAEWNGNILHPTKAGDAFVKGTNEK